MNNDGINNNDGNANQIHINQTPAEMSEEEKEQIELLLMILSCAEMVSQDADVNRNISLTMAEIDYDNIKLLELKVMALKSIHWLAEEGSIVFGDLYAAYSSLFLDRARFNMPTAKSFVRTRILQELGRSYNDTHPPEKTVKPSGSRRERVNGYLRTRFVNDRGGN